MKYYDKKYILKLIQNINKSRMRVKKMLYALEFTDDKWRIVLPASLPDYQFLPSGKKLLEIAVYSTDFQGGYYYIPYSPRP